jgi:hypothetical protein
MQPSQVDRCRIGHTMGSLTTSRKSMASMLYSGRALADVEAQGEAAVAGDRIAVQRFLSCFPSPLTRESSD